MLEAKRPCVYILATKRNGTLYTGVTSSLRSRVPGHREGPDTAFTSRYGVYKLVWFEEHSHMDNAILREKQLKKWERKWKIRLIEKSNPYWRDLYSEIAEGA